MKSALHELVASRYGGRDLPVALQLPDGHRVALSPRPEIDIYARTLSGLKALAQPELGKLARAYVHGDIDFSGSARRILAIAEALVGSFAHGQDALRARLRGWWNQHRSNQANIGHHYDVSNAFYKLWLDERMVYSCAYFRTETDSIDLAQQQKLDHICRKLRLQPGETLLDIGCGWGGLIFWAAQHYGVTAKGVTLSENQFTYVQEQIRKLGLSDRVSVELRDYADLRDDEVFDKIASVGMFEHVGIANFPEYFGKICRLLKPGGFVLNHGITHNWAGAESLGSGISDFVEQYVFPGGQLTHVSNVIQGMALEGLEVVDAEALREHYARTLWHWVDRLESNAATARSEIGEEKYRVWRIYMAGSAHAFERGWLSLFQILAGKPFADGRLPHPPTRDYIYSH
jgi:cyclopropane-fatty-acyl-phospholipid synthase